MRDLLMVFRGWRLAVLITGLITSHYAYGESEGSRDGFSVSLTSRHGGFSRFPTYEVFSLGEDGAIWLYFSIGSEKWDRSVPTTPDLPPRIKAILEQANVFDLRDRYWTEDEGCAPSMTEGGEERISITNGNRKKTISIYGRCHLGTTREAQNQIDKVWTLIKVIQLSLDQPEWLVFRESERRLRVAEELDRVRQHRKP